MQDRSVIASGRLVIAPTNSIVEFAYFATHASLFPAFSFFAAILAQLQFSAGIGFQFFGRVKQANRNISYLCLLASAVNMHSGGLAVDNKIADRQRYFLLSYERWQIIMCYIFYYSITFYLALSMPILHKRRIFLCAITQMGCCKTQISSAKSAEHRQTHDERACCLATRPFLYLYPKGDIYFLALRCRNSSSMRPNWSGVISSRFSSAANKPTISGFSVWE